VDPSGTLQTLDLDPRDPRSDPIPWISLDRMPGTLVFWRVDWSKSDLGSDHLWIRDLGISGSRVMGSDQQPDMAGQDVVPPGVWECRRAGTVLYLGMSCYAEYRYSYNRSLPCLIRLRP
jgi:hypothetical protein